MPLATIADTALTVGAARVSQPLPLGLARSGQRLPLGTMLLETGALTPDQLEVALAEKESTGRLGEILVARGMVSSRALAEALAAQAGLPFGELSRIEFDSTAAGLLPEKFARRSHALTGAVGAGGRRARGARTRR
jgi:hypothetical protein